MPDTERDARLEIRLGQAHLALIAVDDLMAHVGIVPFFL
jgi:hypothetical protein